MPTQTQSTPKSLYNDGSLLMLVKKGLLSSTVLSYFDYYNEHLNHRSSGKTYRLSVSLIAKKYGVSTTTVKLGISKVRD